MESALDKAKRPSVSGKFDSRSCLHKLFDWGVLCCMAPLAAARLPFIDRYPPMIWWDYDDSDDWSAKRWARALEIRWGDQ